MDKIQFFNLCCTTHQVHKVTDAILYSLKKNILHILYNCLASPKPLAKYGMMALCLLYKLKMFLPSTYYLLIKSYLSEHHFQIRYALSDTAGIDTNVLQYGILSPILYKILI